MKMSGKIRLGLIGCGGIMAVHLHGYKALVDKKVNVEITSLCDIDIDNARRFRKRGEGPPPKKPIAPPGDPLSAPHIYVSDFQAKEAEIYDDYRKMLKESDIDAVDIYTSVSAHHPIAVDSLRAGKHVMVEKPFAITVKAARKMTDAADEAKKVLGVAEGIRYLPFVRMTKWAIDKGYVGDVQLAVQMSLGGWWSPDKIVAATPWRHDKLSAGGGATMDMGVHTVDLLRYLFGEIDTVTGLVKTLEETRITRDDSGKIIQKIKADVDDTFLAILKFEKGPVAQVSFSWALHGPPTAPMVLPTIYGSKGVVRMGTIALDDGNKLDIGKLFEERAGTDLKSKLFPYGLTDPAALETNEFLNAIIEGREMETNGGEGLKDIAASYAIIESSRLERTLKVKSVETGEIADYESDINKRYGL
jgi:predicted dehydrogenase